MNKEKYKGLFITKKADNIIKQLNNKIDLDNYEFIFIDNNLANQQIKHIKQYNCEAFNIILTNNDKDDQLLTEVSNQLIANGLKVDFYRIPNPFISMDQLLNTKMSNFNYRINNIELSDDQELLIKQFNDVFDICSYSDIINNFDALENKGIESIDVKQLYYQYLKTNNNMNEYNNESWVEEVLVLQQSKLVEKMEQLKTLESLNSTLDTIIYYADFSSSDLDQAINYLIFNDQDQVDFVNEIIDILPKYPLEDNIVNKAVEIKMVDKLKTNKDFVHHLDQIYNVNVNSLCSYIDVYSMVRSISYCDNELNVSLSEYIKAGDLSRLKREIINSEEYMIINNINKYITPKTNISDKLNEFYNNKIQEMEGIRMENNINDLELQSKLDDLQDRMESGEVQLETWNELDPVVNANDAKKLNEASKAIDTPLKQCNRVTITGVVNKEHVKYSDDNKRAMFTIGTVAYTDKDGKNHYNNTRAVVFGDQVHQLKNALLNDEHALLTVEGSVEHSSKVAKDEYGNEFVDANNKKIYKDYGTELKVKKISNDPSKAVSNKIAINGRVDYVSDLGQTKNGKSFAFATITNSYVTKNKETNEKTRKYQSNKVMAFGKNAEVLASLEEGQEVSLTGTISMDDKDHKNSIVLNRVKPGLTKEGLNKFFDDIEAKKSVQKEATKEVETADIDR